MVKIKHEGIKNFMIKEMVPIIEKEVDTVRISKNLWSDFISVTKFYKGLSWPTKYLVRESLVKQVLASEMSKWIVKLTYNEDHVVLSTGAG